MSIRPIALAAALLAIVGGILVTTTLRVSSQVLHAIAPALVATTADEIPSPRALTLITFGGAAPLAGLLGDKLGRRWMILLSVVTGGGMLAIIATMQAESNALALSFTALALANALAVPNVLSHLLEDTPLEAIAGTIVSAYFGIAYVVGLKTTTIVGSGFANDRLHTFADLSLASASAIGIAGGIGIALIALAKLLNVKAAPTMISEPHGTVRVTSWWRISLPILVAVFLIGIGLQEFNIFLPFFAGQEIGLTSTEYALILGSGFWINLLAFILAGPMADLLEWSTRRRLRRHLGRLAVAGVGLLVFVAGYLVLLTGQTRGLLTIGWMLGSLASAFTGVLFLALFAAGSSTRWRGTAIGLYLAVASIWGFLVTSGLGFLADRIGPRAALQAGFVSSIIAASLCISILVLNRKARLFPAGSVVG